jgi:integrase
VVRPLASNSVAIQDGEIVLIQRPDSGAWQAHYKVDGRWIRVTTKTKKLDDAKKAAKDLYLESQFRLKHNIPVISKKFKDVAKLAIDRMEKVIEGGTGKKTYVDYIQAINKYLIPYFGNKSMDKIDANEMIEFSKWRVEQMRKSPAASTISNHNAALNRVFDEALLHEYVTKAQIPDLQNKGLKAERRAAFTLVEYKELIRGLNEWVKTGRDGKSRDMKMLMRDYVMIVVSTGMRPGTEMEALCWKHVKMIKEKDDYYLLIWVPEGKTGHREIVTKTFCWQYFMRIKDRRALHLRKSLQMSDIKDEPIFALPDGTQTKNLRQTFQAFLDARGLLKDPVTEQERVLYSLRHTYATFQILYRNVDLHLLAKQMGTSIAMIEKHYGHLKPRLAADKLVGNWKK